MKGCAIFFGSIAVGLAVGLVVMSILWTITGDEKTSGAIGTGVWLISAFTIHAYAAVWFTAWGGFSEVETARSKDRFQGKLRTAELRYTIAFSMVGGSLAQAAGAPWYLIAVVTVPLAMLGGILGYDIKRRYRRLGIL